MIRLIDLDGRIAEISMISRNTGLDWSSDFFNAGQLDYDANVDAYIVENAEDCIDQAFDLQEMQGDYYVPDDERSLYDTSMVIARRVNY